MSAFARLTVLAVLTTTCTSEPLSTGPSTVATQLAFTANLGSRVAGQAFAPAVVVEARDASGTLASSFTGDVTIAIGANPSAGSLSGTLTVAAVGGRATFANLSIEKVGSGYTLTANGGSLTPATSAALTITPAAASQLVFTVQPSTTTAGASINPLIQVTALDAFGNVATGFGLTVTLALGANPTGASLFGRTMAPAVRGVATFITQVHKRGAGYTLVATGAGLTSATSTSFDIDVGPAAALAFTVQPAVARFSCPTGLTIAPFRLSVTDAFGNAVVSDTRDVHVALGSAWGNSLSGTTTVAAVAGVAAFSDLTVDGIRMGYTLVATASGLTSVTSSPFVGTDACSASHLIFSVQPTTTVAGAAITPAVVVCGRDNQGNVGSSYSGNVTVAIGTNPAGGTLAGTVVAVAVAGCATFSNLRIDTAGSGYTLAVTASGLVGATSRAFNIVSSP